MTFKAACILALGLMTSVSSAALAALPVGHAAPAFSLQASMAGREFTFSLAEALKKGPVVLYFYPAAFTPGCTVEAHDFAEAMDDFHDLGATVIGVSMDDIAKLTEFSISECRSRFAVAADTDGRVADAYDARSANATHASRISYVIAPDGKVLMTYADRSPDQHVAHALATLRAWKSAGK